MLAYEASDNLAELTSRLAPVAGAGDPGARWMLAKSIQECFPPKIYPNYYELGRKGAQAQPEPRRTLTLRHLERNQRRCAQLLAEGRVTHEAETQAFEAALQGTDVASQASRLVSTSMAAGEPIVGDETRSVQRRIVSSRDPWAIWAMADLMGPVPDEGERVYGPFSGSWINQWAWKLAACRLGYPCGPDSVEVRTRCISASECVNGGVPEMIRHYYLSPHDHELAQATAEKLLALIAAGNVDAIFP